MRHHLFWNYIFLLGALFLVFNCSQTTSSTAKTKRPFYRPPNWNKPIPKKTTVKEGNLDTRENNAIVTPSPLKTDPVVPPFQREQMDGYASWYGPGFHGKLTANGEKYDQHIMTAAHKILPMNTVVRVINLENQSAITVRINDRGPYKKDRIIDLTQRGAELLGFLEKGTTRVTLEIVKFPDDFDPKEGLLPYKQVVIQLAVFNDQANAERYKNDLAKKYQKLKFFIDPYKKPTYHVVAGPYQERADANTYAEALKSDGVKNFVRSYRK